MCLYSIYRICVRTDLYRFKVTICSQGTQTVPKKYPTVTAKDFGFPTICFPSVHMSTIWSTLITVLILQALGTWQHFCHNALPLQLFSVQWKSSVWTWLWWHAIILHVNIIRMPDLLECQRALSPWYHRQLKQHNGLAELFRMQWARSHVFMWSHALMPACIKRLAHKYAFTSVWVSFSCGSNWVFALAAPIASQSQTCFLIISLCFCTQTMHVIAVARSRS